MVSIDRYFRHSTIDWEKVILFEKLVFAKIDYYQELSTFRLSKSKSYFSHVKELLIDFLSSDYRLAYNSEFTDVLFFKSMERADYNSFFTHVLQLCDEPNQELKITKQTDTKINLRRLLLLMRNWHLFFYLWKGSWFANYYFLLKLIAYSDLLNQLRIISTRMLVVFSDMQPLDNMLVQWFSQNGAITATMQHGLYVDYNDPADVNSLNYTNLVADHILCWGEITASLVRKYNQEISIHIVGKPLAETHPITEEKPSYFTVFFDQEVYKEYNRKLLKEAYQLSQEINLEVNVMLHPNNSINDYEFSASTIFGENYLFSSFCLAHTTSMIYQSLRYGVACFKLKSPIPALPVPEQMDFCNAEEVLHKLNHLSDIVEFGKRYIAYIGVSSEEQYRSFFNYMLK